MNDLRESVAEITGATVTTTERVQSLWGGYGQIVRARLDSGSVIVKCIRPPPLGRHEDVSHTRKRRSYEVELAFYRSFASRCDGCRVANLIGHRVTKDTRIIVLEDLDQAGFALRRTDPRGSELDACLQWLASFHARFLGVKPEGLWKIGTYWHLATRRDELAEIRDAGLRAKAPEIDRILNAARFQTFVHGDAKPENFCFSHDDVAAVDFQYVGGGSGIKDVAYLLHGLPAGAEEQGVRTYFALLRSALGASIDRDALEREWHDLYPIAKQDFERFLAGWRYSR